MKMIDRLRQFNETPTIVEDAVKKITALLIVIVLFVAATFLAVVS